MRHLRTAELLALAEGRQTEGDVPHLATCDRCRGELAGLRSALRAVSAVDVPEPSPLFWEHLSSRVHEAVAAEPLASSTRWRFWSIPWRLTTVSALTAAGAVAVALVVMPKGPGQAPQGSVVERPLQTVSVQHAADTADDESLMLLGDLVGTVDWDKGPVGLDLEAGPLDRGLADLTADLTDEQRGEVQRVLKEEMKSHGA
jgi:hypothetical protein